MDDEIVYKGRRYATRRKFCERTGIAERTLTKYIAKGVVKAEKLRGYKVSYIDIENGIKEINLLPKKTKRRKLEGFANRPKDAKVKQINIPEISDPAIEKDDGIPLLGLSQYSKEEYSDCVINGIFDYDRLKTRITAETYQFKLEKEMGMHIPKTDILDWAKTLATILKTNVDAIPSRFAAILIATAEKITKYEFTEEERVEVRNALKAIPAQIMLSIQAEMRRYADE